MSARKLFGASADSLIEKRKFGRIHSSAEQENPFFFFFFCKRMNQFYIKEAKQKHTNKDKLSTRVVINLSNDLSST